MVLTQEFQHARGTVRSAGQQVATDAVVLRGDQLSFVVTLPYKGSPLRYQFRGKVAADAIDGDVTMSGARLHGAAEWNAKRTERGAGRRTPSAHGNLALQTR